MEKIDSLIWIENDANLKSLLPLNGVSAPSIKNLIIRNNSELSECHAHSICEYLSVPDSMAMIVNNALGCNTRVEVEDRCLSDINDLSIEQIKVYPNPTSDFIFLSENVEPNAQISIYDTSGETILVTQGVHEIDLSHFPKGMYLLMMIGEEGAQYGKVIKL